MLTRPDTCRPCPLAGLATGFMQAARGRLPIAFLGEALGKAEAERGLPFVGAAGFQAGKLLRHIGLTPEDFSWANAIWCRPPNNVLDGAPYKADALKFCQQYWRPFLVEVKPKVIMPLGNVALEVLLGQHDILGARGYPQWSEDWQAWILPTVHPSFILRGNTNYATCFIADVQKALRIAEHGVEQHLTRYLIDPTPGEALGWATEWSQYSDTLALDIETPRKVKAEDEDEIEDDAGPDPITRIGFSYRPYEAMSIPWAAEYMAAIRLLCEVPLQKVFWNAAFDVPRIEAQGVKVVGRPHPMRAGYQVVDDAMWAWHVFQSDQPKGLAHATSLLQPDQLAWKYLASRALGFYNCVDVDVTRRDWTVLMQEMVK